MTSGIFKVIGQTADILDTSRLKLFGLIHCRHTIRKKAHFFYEFLQQGGPEKFPQISAGDKDFAPNFEKLCDVACWNLFEALNSINVIEELYTPEEIAKLKEQVEALREDMFIDDMYGNYSRLDYADFCENCYLRASWVFSSSEIRSKLFKLAEVDIKHLKAPETNPA